MTDYTPHEDHTPKQGDILAGWTLFIALVVVVALTAG